MKKDEPKVIEVPSSQDFANQLVNSFLQEEGISIEAQDDEEPIQAVLSIPDIHIDFTLWLCNLVRESSYEDTKCPDNTMLN